MKLDRLWWALGVVFVLAALVLCLLPARDVRAIESFDKASHIAGHALLAVYFAGLVPRARWWRIFVFLLLMGAVVEVAQHLMHLGREADVRDVVANSIGAVIGLILARAGLERWPRWAAWLLRQQEAA